MASPEDEQSMPYRDEVPLVVAVLAMRNKVSVQHNERSKTISSQVC